MRQIYKTNTSASEIDNPAQILAIVHRKTAQSNKTILKYETEIQRPSIQFHDERVIKLGNSLHPYSSPVYDKT